MTPLGDWLPHSETDDQVGNFISPIDNNIDLYPTLSPQTGHLSDTPKAMTDEEAFESGIVEIYGPLAK